MKQEEQEYENLKAEYRVVYAEYERLTAEMLALATDADSKIEAYRQASQEAAKLFEQLAAMRKTMKYKYGGMSQVTTAQDRPAYPGVP